MASVITQPLRINGLELPGRVFKCATTETLAEEDGTISDAFVRFYEPIAWAGTPLIITGNMYVGPSGKATYRTPGIEHDERIPGLRRFTEMVHGHGSRTVVQINHCGRQANPQVGGYEQTIAPSPVLEKTGFNRPRGMTLAEIDRTVEEFAAAAGRAREAGFDGVEIHMSHGYLLNEFLTPYTNRRTDHYGGSFTNRLRLPREVTRAVRERVGPDYPVLVKLNGDDLLMVRGGTSTDEFVRVALALQEDGIDAVEISCAHYESGFPMMRGRFDDFMRTYAYQGQGAFLPSWRRRLIAAVNRPFAALANRRWSAQEGFNLPFARAFSAALDVPVITVGGFITRAAIEGAISSGATDAVSIGRAMIADPLLYRHLVEGGTGPRCDYCNQCVARGGHQGVDCYNPTLRPARQRMLAEAGFDARSRVG
jgi:2,4-dienoyl-CoA reductase-like NADH-dependent reductase (Old Yellow Enzyme family)